MAPRHLTAAMAALVFIGATAPAVGALAADHQGGGGGGHAAAAGHAGGHSAGGYRGGGGGGYYRGGGGYGYRGGGGGGLVAGLALGAALGYYAGHPYYCRDHRHWRWNPYYGRYVYYYGGGYC